MMKGWKTWTGIIGLLVTMIAQQYFGVDMEAAGVAANKMFTAIEAVFGALTVVGIGHKVEKGAIPQVK